MQSSNLITDSASSLAIHRNDADVFRRKQSEGGIKRESDRRYYYADYGYETASLREYDSGIQRERRASENHERIEALKRDIAGLKRDLAAKPTILRKLELVRDLQDAERKLKRLESFDIQANRKAVARFVALHNFDNRRPYQEKQYQRARKEHEKSLILANLCPQCFQPIHTEKLQVVEVIGASFGFDAERMEQAARKAWAELRENGLQKRKARFRHVRITTIEIAEIQAHYRHFKFTDKQGQVKLFYGLIDGSTRAGRLLPMKVSKGRFGQPVYMTIPDLLPLDGMPSESYKMRGDITESDSSPIRCKCND